MEDEVAAVGGDWSWSDRFGIPRNVLNLTDDFYGGLGRVAALASIVELRLSNVVAQWGGRREDDGQPVNALKKRFKAIEEERRGANKEMPDALSAAVVSATDALQERNEVLHSLWPREDSGWRNRPTGTVTTTYQGVEDLQGVIERLLAASDALFLFLRSPID